MFGEYANMTGVRPQVKASLNRGHCMALDKPSQSFSQSMGNSFRQTMAGIFSHSKVTETTMLSSHIEQTAKRCQSAEGKYIICPQDTTYYNYQGHGAMEGLGIIQGKIKGIIQHNVLALDAEGIPQGIIYQKYWSRDGAKDFEGIESAKWEEGLSAVNKHLVGVEKTVVVVSDREGDIFDFFKAERAKNVELLTRVCQPRNLIVLDKDKKVKLPEIAHELTSAGNYEVEVQRDSQTVRITLAISYGRVDVLPPKNSTEKLEKTANLSMVVAQEIAATNEKGEDVFDEKKAACWYLLTSLPVTTIDEAILVVQFYALRWRIERFHFTLKSGGYNVEKLQFDDLQTTINAITFYSIATWELLRLTYLVRQQHDQPATVCYDEQEIELLQKVSKKKVVTITDAVLALAALVGFARSKKQPLPGVKVLAQAIERFYYVKLGSKS